MPDAIGVATPLAERREALVADARKLARHLNNPQACAQAAVALVILRRHGLDGLRLALRRELPSEVLAPAWAQFGRVMQFYIDKGPYQDVVELAFVLGWLKRLAKITAADRLQR